LIDAGAAGVTTARNARSNLGLGSMATQAAEVVAITGGTISAAVSLNIVGDTTP
jgi:hypothetical protein